MPYNAELLLSGGAHMHFIDTSDIHVFTRHVLAPPLAEAQRYSEIRDRIIFDFYPGLPHM